MRYVEFVKTLTLKISKHCEFFFSGLYHDIMTPCQVSEILVIVFIFLIFLKEAQIQIWNILVIPSIFLEFLGTIMFIWFFLCLCNFYRFFCNLIEVPTVQNCCTFWILLIFPEGINKLYYMFKFNKTLSWSNWSAAPLISLPKLKVAGSSLCGAHIFLHIKTSGMSLGSPCFIQLKDSKLIPFHIFFFQSSNKKQMRWRSQLMPATPGHT